MNEKLKEFVEKYSFHCGVGCEVSSRDVEQFAQAVADFTEKNNHARLNTAQVGAIRMRIGRGETYATITGEYGISDTHARNIVSRKAWK